MENNQGLSSIVPIDDQPIAASFFGEGRWLTDFITPGALDIAELYKEITDGIGDRNDRITACWAWVAKQVKYVKFVEGKIWINGQSSVQRDLWTLPQLTVQTQVGNCAVKSFLLTSLLRNELSPDQVYCALGNLYNGKPGGHAWVALKNEGVEYVMETTQPAGPALVLASKATRYEPVHYFNDAQIYAIEGKTQLVPMTACYSSWLSDYLKWAYIEAQGI